MISYILSKFPLISLLENCACNKYTFIIITVLLLLIYYKVKKAYEYFSVRGIPYIRPSFLLGSNLSVFLFRETLEDNLDRMYKDLSGHKYGGFYQFLQPVFVIRDPELIENILVRDFSYFHDHVGKIDVETNPLEGSLFNLKGQNWKILRTRLSPIFSSGKLKWMFNQIVTCADDLIKSIDKVADGNDVNVRTLISSHGLDVIASCAFGIDGQSLKNPYSKFNEMVHKTFYPSKLVVLRFITRIIFPHIADFFKVKILPDEINDFFIGLTKETIENRIKTGAKRNDFVQLLLQLKEKGYIEYDPLSKPNIKERVPCPAGDGKYVFTYDVLAAQAFVFFVAGFEKPTSLIIYTLYYFALHKEVQEKVRREIILQIVNNNGLNYESLKRMTYLDCCVSETLRLHPPNPFIERECTKPYKIDENVSIEKGAAIFIPVQSLHHDPEYFPEPGKFHPDRFMDSLCSIRRSCGKYLPFGDGPRMCIARRFALLNAKLVIVKILLNFEINKSPKNIVPLKRDPTIFIDEPKGGLFLRIERIQNPQ